MSKFNLLTKNQKTNWKYLLIVIILGFIVGGGILWWERNVVEEIKMPEIKISKVKEEKPQTHPVTESAPKLVEEKIPNELASIFSKKMNMDLVGRETYYSDIAKSELPPDIKAPTDPDCIFSESVDLNNYGIEEFIIYPGGLCGTMEIRGASGNGPIYIFQQITEGWQIIGKLMGNMINIEKTITNGYYDISTYWHLSAVSGIKYFYQWEEINQSYKLKKSEETEVGL